MKREDVLKVDLVAIPALGLLMIFTIAMALTFRPVTANATDSDSHVHFDQKSAKLVGEKVVGEVAAFYKETDSAIEAKDLDRLMDLYSDAYQDGSNDKKTLREIWTRIFARFDKLYMRHNMRFADISKDGETVVIRCSGVLMGAPKDDQFSRALDHWLNNDHVLVKEEGKWRLKGTVGKKELRFWLKNPSNPLV
jgi:ketosteroid isomerase-like protein